MNIRVSMVMLLTGCLTVSLLKIETPSVETNATAIASSSKSNKTFKRSFDFPTIFYPGPDNRFITLAPLPKLPHKFHDSTSTRRHKTTSRTKNWLDETLSSERPIPQHTPTTSIQINRPFVVSKIRFPATAEHRPRHGSSNGFHIIKSPELTLATPSTSTKFTRPTLERRPTLNKISKHQFSHQNDPLHPTTFRPPLLTTTTTVQKFPEVKFVSTTEFSLAEKDLRPPLTISASQRRLNFNEVHDAIPQTSFVCRPKMMGYYADVETDCQTFHICHDRRRYSFRCPVGTRFSQSILVCDWHHRVKCSW